MSVERLHFAPGVMPYVSMLAAEHVARYAFAAVLCRGRRVLDVACGEGYGSAMLAEAGAAEVVGVDISADAVSQARARFGRDGVTFLAGDATDLPALLADHAPFDLIVSFETIEHLADSRPFLEGLRALRAPGGDILISAPNEGDDGAVSANPFHCRAFTPDSFRATTEAVLGPADAIWHGMPMQGFGILPAGSPLCTGDSEGLEAMLEGGPVSIARLLPAQRGHHVDARRTSFMIAAWGGAASATVVAAPVAFEAHVEMWRALDWTRAENARLLRERAATQDGAAPLEREAWERIADYQRAAVLDAERLQSARDACARAEAALARLVAERVAERAADGAARSEADAALAGVRAELAQREADLATIRSEADAALAGVRAELAQREADLATIRASRSWRALRVYAGLYERPVVGPPLRALRRSAGRVLRAVRGG